MWSTVELFKQKWQKLQELLCGHEILFLTVEDLSQWSLLCCTSVQVISGGMQSKTEEDRIYFFAISKVWKKIPQCLCLGTFRNLMCAEVSVLAWKKNRFCIPISVLEFGESFSLVIFPACQVLLNTDLVTVLHATNKKLFQQNLVPKEYTPNLRNKL